MRAKVAKAKLEMEEIQSVEESIEYIMESDLKRRRVRSADLVSRVVVDYVSQCECYDAQGGQSEV